MRIAVAGATGLIGSKLSQLAAGEGHEVVAIARETGFDLLTGDGLDAALTGADVVVDVTQSPTLDEAEASTFFETVARNLGESAHRVGVPRTVALSIVGADKSPDYGYYVAKVAQENAHRRYSPEPVVLRATQFHEFAGQMLGWNRSGSTTSIIDVPTQPVATAEIVRLLLDLATGARTGDTELAGPKVEQLVDQVRELVRRSGEDLEVVAVPGPPSMAGGSMLPDDAALLRGPDWLTWLDEQQG
ncbi:SDR family oxidoreductase [Nocardioides marmorisolisilvae]|uniref:NAD-dependent epimerase/dehydratase family protein n=1 Tax=Nocardioides marmorisolisilvae TaxID=1542737 RepID=A0A3N0E0H9_9ACTN|nr:NAD-dependent epimerase/dehydratase family protein [Nocardioides marmorisolisilvae]RNL81335.1 NAD-dependent epimerase/dehydratase family protein [Nocardioides marmorisolisilvae]